MGRGLTPGILATLGLLVLSPGAAAKTYEVTTTADHSPADCTEADCTLREAVRAANAHGGPDEIALPGSRKPYRLTRAGLGEDQAKRGDLDIREAVEIRGASPRKAVIKQTEGDRVFEVPGATDGYVTLKKLTVTGAG